MFKFEAQLAIAAREQSAINYSKERMIDELKPNILNTSGRAEDIPMLRREWWHDFASSLSIDKLSAAEIQPLHLDDGATRMIRELIRREGYIQGSVGQWKLPLSEMAGAVNKLKVAGLFPVFALIYDEFWMLAQRLAQALHAVLGEQYYMLPDFWVWHVDPKRDERGWRPHRDKGYRSLLPDGSPKSVTLWVPLTAATTLNGCMYIVPADRDPTYGTENDHEWKFQHQDVRALPAQPGEFFMWNQAVVHWGSHASPRGEAARLSVAFEFQRADIPPLNTPLIEPQRMLSFDERIRLIAKQILQYQHMYPLSDAMKEIVNTMSGFEERISDCGNAS